MIRRTPTLLAPTLLGLATTLLLTACGGDSGGEAAATSSSSAACTSSPATADAPASVSTDLTQAPEVPAADGPPPCGLVISDVVVGDGATAVAGAPVEVKYVGAFYDTGESFDSSWSRGDDETLPFTAGAGQVIPGFDTGVTGMAVGGAGTSSSPATWVTARPGRGRSRPTPRWCSSSTWCRWAECRWAERRAAGSRWADPAGRPAPPGASRAAS